MRTEDLYKIFLKYPKICTDSRKSTPDSMFFALKGDNFDGNHFAAKALEKCDIAIIDNKKFYSGNNTILVDDCLQSLQQLANHHRKKLGTKIIALTGTNGKTTTKELIRDVLLKSYNVTATSGNLNNHIGVPLTLLEMDKTSEIAVVEMGANHLNEIKHLCQIAEPDYGLITNIGYAHLEGFGSFENIVKAKSEIYNYLIDNNKIVFQNNANSLLKSLTANYNTVKYDSGNFLENDQSIDKTSLFLNFDYKGKTVQTHLIGEYNYENVLAAITIGEYFDIALPDIISAIDQYKPLNIRSQYKQTKYNKLILDAYNANPSSMKLAIDNFYKLSVVPKVLILGDMFELGQTSSNEHTQIVQYINELNFAEAYLIGNEFNKSVGKYNYSFFRNTNEFVKWLTSSPLKHKNILIKGSRGMQLEKLVEYL